MTGKHYAWASQALNGQTKRKAILSGNRRNLNPRRLTPIWQVFGILQSVQYPSESAVYMRGPEPYIKADLSSTWYKKETMNDYGGFLKDADQCVD